MPRRRGLGFGGALRAAGRAEVARQSPRDDPTTRPVGRLRTRVSIARVMMAVEAIAPCCISLSTSGLSCTLAELFEVRREIRRCGTTCAAQARRAARPSARARRRLARAGGQRRRLGRRIAPRLGAQRRIVAFHARAAGARATEGAAHQISRRSASRPPTSRTSCCCCSSRAQRLERLARRRCERRLAQPVGVADHREQVERRRRAAAGSARRAGRRARRPDET